MSVQDDLWKKIQAVKFSLIWRNLSKDPVETNFIQRVECWNQQVVWKFSEKKVSLTDDERWKCEFSIYSCELKDYVCTTGLWLVHTKRKRLQEQMCFKDPFTRWDCACDLVYRN